MPGKLKAPFPYFGGKSKVASVVWQAFGNCKNYVEPFAGSLAVLLARPEKHFQGGNNLIETVNELNPYISNFWRCVTHDPEQLAFYADHPVLEVDLHARHLWLINQGDFRERMFEDPDYYDAKIGGWYVWGLSQWIGHGWCAVEHLTKDGVPWKRPLHLSSAGQGVTAITHKLPTMKGTGGGHRQSLQSPTQQIPFLHRPGQGIHQAAITRKMPCLSSDGQGVNKLTRQLPFVGHAGRGDAAPSTRSALYEYFDELANRLRNVRVTCGDFARVLGPSVTQISSTNAVFLDPPYLTNGELYGVDLTEHPARRAFAWAKENWSVPGLRIAFCGYEGEFDIPSDWRCYAWKGAKGYANEENENRYRERIWFNPACIPLEEKPMQLGFDFEVA